MKKKQRNFLSRQEVYKLIDIWAEHIDQLRRTFRNKEVYKSMSLELRARHRLTLSCEEIRSRIANLKKQFKIEKKSELCGRASTWPYFKKVNELLEEGNTNKSEKSHDKEPDIYEQSASEELKREESVASGSRSKRKLYEVEFLKIAKEEQKNMKKYFKNSLENDEKIIKLLQKNNDLLSQLLYKA
ncbi:myb/SANT-like DNA-binding domain-containing protein 1 isoform X2 [Ceratitis capitata]|uniref:(Mediterranean fruit fly) hypothetical protein n=1 Tax=Ceratitis capitata TaxID=7213 RepID=A0A811UG64_CERCA|nr:myb/SANT-like DNA-binding domain-containing protein 1 isoform X2 [Ceratitis capitata]CAD6996867.1 unnamed protein product [Ceratitis capitata]